MPNQMSFSRTGAAGDVTNARTSGNIAKFIPRNSKPSGSEAARSLPSVILTSYLGRAHPPKRHTSSVLQRA